MERYERSTAVIEGQQELMGWLNQRREQIRSELSKRDSNYKRGMKFLVQYMKDDGLCRGEEAEAWGWLLGEVEKKKELQAMSNHIHDQLSEWMQTHKRMSTKTAREYTRKMDLMMLKMMEEEQEQGKGGSYKLLKAPDEVKAFLNARQEALENEMKTASKNDQAAIRHLLRYVNDAATSKAGDPVKKGGRSWEWWMFELSIVSDVPTLLDPELLEDLCKFMTESKIVENTQKGFLIQLNKLLAACRGKEGKMQYDVLFKDKEVLGEFLKKYREDMEAQWNGGVPCKNRTNHMLNVLKRYLGMETIEIEALEKEPVPRTHSFCLVEPKLIKAFFDQYTLSETERQEREEILEGSLRRLVELDAGLEGHSWIGDEMTMYDLLTRRMNEYQAIVDSEKKKNGEVLLHFFEHIRKAATMDQEIGEEEGGEEEGMEGVEAIESAAEEEHEVSPDAEEHEVLDKVLSEDLTRNFLNWLQATESMKLSVAQKMSVYTREVLGSVMLLHEGALRPLHGQEAGNLVTLWMEDLVKELDDAPKGVVKAWKLFWKYVTGRDWKFDTEGGRLPLKKRRFDGNFTRKYRLYVHQEHHEKISPYEMKMYAKGLAHDLVPEVMNQRHEELSELDSKQGVSFFVANSREEVWEKIKSTPGYEHLRPWIMENLVEIYQGVEHYDNESDEDSEDESEIERRKRKAKAKKKMLMTSTKKRKRKREERLPGVMQALERFDENHPLATTVIMNFKAYLKKKKGYEDDSCGAVVDRVGRYLSELMKRARQKGNAPPPCLISKQVAADFLTEMEARLTETEKIQLGATEDLSHFRSFLLGIRKVRGVKTGGSAGHGHSEERVFLDGLSSWLIGKKRESGATVASCVTLARELIGRCGARGGKQIKQVLRLAFKRGVIVIKEGGNSVIHEYIREYVFIKATIKGKKAHEKLGGKKLKVMVERGQSLDSQNSVISPFGSPLISPSGRSRAESDADNTYSAPSDFRHSKQQACLPQAIARAFKEWLLKRHGLKSQSPYITWLSRILNAAQKRLGIMGQLKSDKEVRHCLFVF